MVKPSISIIIPHYEIPGLLSRCLMSIPVSKDIQVIVIDDNSSEETILKLKTLQLDYPHVEFVYSEMNGGGGKARNIGLDHAKGRYVLFADADDFFNNCITEILDDYSNTPYDIVFFNANVVDTETLLPSTRGTTLHGAIKDYNENHDIRVFQYLFGEPWCKLVKRSIIEDNHIRFDETRIHNDTRFSYFVGYYARNVKYDNRVLYCVTDRTGSVSKGLTDEKWRIRTRVFAEKNCFLANHGIPFFDKLMITPFIHYLKQRDLTNLKRCLSITTEYGFSSFFVLSKVLRLLFRV